MVAGAVARPRATPEPRVRALRRCSGQACPSRGSSEYGRLVLGIVLGRSVQCPSTGPLSLAPCAVDDVMAVTMKPTVALQPDPLRRPGQYARGLPAAPLARPA